ncbi:MAG: ribosome biogenesis factor YjgA [Pseudomonadota bacterium]
MNSQPPKNPSPHADDHDEAIEFIQLDGDDDGSPQPPTPMAPEHQPPSRRVTHRIAQALPGEDEVLPPSKTKIKQQMHDLQDIGKELVELGKDQLAQLDLPENLRDAIREMHRIKKFGAQRRQMQYIGKLMRDVDPQPILARLDVWKGRSHQHIAYTHQLERWRERLLENPEGLTQLMDSYPAADAQHLRNLIRNAIKEKETGKPPKNFREIYQVLRDIIPEPD